MPIDPCKQQLEHVAQFASADLQSEVWKRLASLNAGQRGAITAWASDELKRLTQPGAGASKCAPPLHPLPSPPGPAQCPATSSSRLTRREVKVPCSTADVYKPITGILK